MLAEEIMIKKIIFITLLTLSSHLSAKEVLVVGTYDSFSSEWGPGPEIELKFEEICNCDVQYVATNQAGSLNSNIFKKGKDILLGVEVNDFNEEDSGYWVCVIREVKTHKPRRVDAPPPLPAPEGARRD